MLHRETITPCPTWKSPTWATLISVEPAAVAAVVSKLEPEAPHSATFSQAGKSRGAGAGGSAARIVALAARTRKATITRLGRPHESMVVSP